MPTGDDALMTLVRAIVVGDTTQAGRLIDAAPDLATAREPIGATRESPTEYFFEEILHYIYGGDTALHMAAAAYQPEIIERLVAHGADVRAGNRRGAQPLHYAADGGPGAAHWNPPAQAATIARLLVAGADPNALDKSGVAPLHRAVRTRCACAVQALLEGGADPELTNKSGSTPLDLATGMTGRGGSGSPEARAQQAVIVELLTRASAAS